MGIAGLYPSPDALCRGRRGRPHTASEKTFQQFARMPVQQRGVFHAELHAITSRYQQTGAPPQAPNVLFGLENQAGRATVRFYTPGTGG